MAASQPITHRNAYQAQPNRAYPSVSGNEGIPEGRMVFYCDDKILSVNAGEVAFLPQGKAHAFYIRSPIVRALIAVQATDKRAVGLDRYFIDMGEPAASMELPVHQGTHIMSDPAHAIRVAAANGIRILSPAETAELLPHYPGFGIDPD